MKSPIMLAIIAGDMIKITDNAWLHAFDQYYKEHYTQLLKSGKSTTDAIVEAFQMTVDLEKHPYSPEPIPVSHRMLTVWGEEFQKEMNEVIHIAFINPETAQMGVIGVTRKWLCCDLSEWLIDNGHYDYFYEIPDDDVEQIEHFLFTYCDFSQNQLHWMVVPESTQFQNLTEKDFQK